MDKLKFGLAASALLLALNVNAAEPFYLGAQVNYINGDTGYGDVNPMALSINGGYQLNPNIALEARIGVGVTDDTVIGVDVELDQYYAGYVVGSYPLSKEFSVYGMVGFSDVEITATANGRSASASDDGISYGLGGVYNFNNNIGLNLEYVLLAEDINSLNFGVTYKF